MLYICWPFIYNLTFFKDMQWVQMAVLFVNDRERSVIGELWLAKLPNIRGRSRTQMLTEGTAVCY